MLELVPWSGDSLNDENPDAPMRTLAFGPTGEGLLTYLIRESQDRVDLLDILWIG